MNEVELTNRIKYYLMGWTFLFGAFLLAISIIADVCKLPNKTYTIISIFVMFVGFWYGKKFGSRSIKEDNIQH